ncbi:hypothetical protein DERP_000482 [Dermatophagoides pteronyssinus]|uniref:Uncharacterized protein n=1 Tax=Dermatophagoides pteronyssinus TaxID=6956 RepID=A0ABQ8J091_DERPT|nr:hypothetical protein DERP_000482 [Dermatophagoides pteronyssinus]
MNNNKRDLKHMTDYVKRSCQLVFDFGYIFLTSYIERYDPNLNKVKNGQHCNVTDKSKTRKKC